MMKAISFMAYGADILGMWLEGGMESINSTAYPEYTMSDAVCPASDFSIILSYDHSELKW